jgi:hypothetical protein
MRRSFVLVLGLLACGKQGDQLTSKDEAVSAPASVAAVASGGIAGSVAERRDLSAEATDEVMQKAAAPPSADPSTIKAPVANVDTAPSMIIRNGQASIEVDKLDPAVAKIRQLAAQLGGYIGNTSMLGGHDQVRTATLEMKIPAPRFDQALNGLNSVGKVENVNSTAEDVGEEFVDVSARVANAHRLEERLIALLATRTGKLQDVLSVERELARVREEVERYEGHLRYLKSRVATSTLSVTVHEPTPILGRTPGDNPIVAAIRQAWRYFVSFIAGSIALTGILVPLTALIVVGWIVYRKIRRRMS